ncbi:MAG: transporter substrate-binding domain-containing protein [Oscillospiraceae bacterium]|jgi:polar amino acid transport system substrate-binding protein|nr:transporter substrate-binding domain-containing protein [Oscillospiraceae bacterium]
MKRVSLFLALILAAAMLFGTVAYADKLDDIKASGKLIVGSELNFPPYEFYFTNPETGEEEAQGFEMQLARGIADALGVELDLRDQSFSGLITALRSGELDCIISGMSIKPERAEVVDFSNAYFGGTQILLSSAKLADSLAVPEDLAGKNLGAQTGSLQAGVAEEQFASANIVLMDKVPLLVYELRLGNLDAVLLTDVVAQTYTTLYPDELKITTVPVVYSSPGSGIAVQKGDNETLLAFLNDYIAQVKGDGTFDQWFADAVALNAQLVAAEEE